MKPIDVKTATGFWIHVAVLAMMCGGMGLGLVVAAIRNLRPPYSHGAAGVLVPLLFGLVVAALPAILVLGRRSWVLRFDAEGVTRGDGRQLPWRRLEAIRTLRRRWYDSVVVNNYELRFRGGARAYVFPRALANHSEVVAVIAALGGQTDVRR